MERHLQSKDDPHGVQALLATLRRQQDRPPATAPAPVPAAPIPTKRDEPIRAEYREEESAKRRRIDSKSPLPPSGASAGSGSSNSSSDNLRHVSLAQALPHLARLSKDEKFLAALLKLKADQDAVEDKLAAQRREMAKRKPTPTANQLREWDLDALIRWDALYTQQQKGLEAMGVPCFYVTKDQGQRKKQERVFQVLAGLLE